ncbi:DUF397 domain-containing protein [Solihabitans fulvus]|uniref:DUF397 domain-containing protein n=1 Tax=Solihabitans fulvus TaxID=1892852 RepID=A0A5B2X4J7_9PSEU|nr:DUF397 domain-containing protein [Solihabitans fulvus]KAA2258041.1 DUF397 domain-containing protein [Solihabitans fulvus]
MNTTTWRKSSRSGQGANNCVEVAHLPGVVAVRDSKNPSGPILRFDEAALIHFLRGVKASRLDG